MTELLSRAETHRRPRSYQEFPHLKRLQEVLLERAGRETLKPEEVADAS